MTDFLDTARLRLRPFSSADVDAVHAYHRLDAVARFQFWEPRTREEVATEVDDWVRQHMAAQGEDCAVFAVTLKQDGTLIGDMVLFFRDREARQGEIGFTFHPGFGGQGYATEAARAVLGFGFGPCGLHRIFGRCDARNAASWRLMERLGMRREAHFREHALFKGEWDQEYYYALLAREWAEQDREEA
ncbi:GNAT family N-acetyltransferase [Hoeflea olei]|nr:GNAT family protein [Hoeflea olei]